MQPGIGSFAFGWAVGHAKPPLDARGLLEFARRHGLFVVQLGDNLPVHEMSGARLAALATEACADIDATLALERATVERSVETLKGWLA